MHRRRGLALAAMLCVAACASTTTPMTTPARPLLSSGGGAALRGSWSSVCDATGQIEAVDPVVAHGEPVSMHVHQFFGAPSITPDTTPADLQAGTDVCTTIPDPENIADHNAYWAPVLYRSPAKRPGEAVRAVRVVAYFRTRGLDPTTIQVPPEGFNLVAGNSAAMLPGDNPHAIWACVSGPGTPAVTSPTIPDSCPVQDSSGQPYRLRLIIRFPSCYYGGGGPYNYTKAAAYPTAGDPATCPQWADPIPELDTTFRYFIGTFPRLDNGTPDDPTDDTWDLTGATLASDDVTMTMPDGSQMTTGSHGITAHADFMSGYTLAENTQLVDDCFHQTRNCGIVRARTP